MSAQTPLVRQLRASSRVVVVQPWMVRELGLAAVWFAQLLWLMDRFDTATVVRGDHEWEPETGLNRAQVLRAKAKVIELGWITCEVRKVRGTPTSHIALDDDALETFLRTIHCPESNSPGSRGIEQSSTDQLSLEVDGGEGASGGQSTVDERVAQLATTWPAFWAAYPNPAAKQAGAKAIRDTDPAVIIAGAERYASEIAGRDGFRGAHASTWLNGRRWEDPPGANAVGRPTRGAAAPVTIGREGPSGRVKM